MLGLARWAHRCRARSGRRTQAACRPAASAPSTSSAGVVTDVQGGRRQPRRRAGRLRQTPPAAGLARPRSRALSDAHGRTAPAPAHAARRHCRWSGPRWASARPAGPAPAARHRTSSTCWRAAKKTSNAGVASAGSSPGGQQGAADGLAAQGATGRAPSRDARPLRRGAGPARPALSCAAMVAGACWCSQSCSRASARRSVGAIGHRVSSRSRVRACSCMAGRW